MKKSLFFVAAAALVLAGCNNDVTLDENTALAGSNTQKEIGFFPLSHSPKRASSTNHGAVEGTTFPTGIDMMVAAWDQVANRDFFEATNFKYKYANGSSGAEHTYWGGETPRYWPLSATYLNFLAIANANDNNVTSVSWGTGGSPAAYASQVVVSFLDNYAYDTKQHDFLYAIGHGEVTQSGNALTFVNNGIVDMTFKHAQAYLLFNLRAADDASQAIKIKDVEISGARFAGTATIRHENYNATSGQAVHLFWSPSTQTAAYKSVLDNQTAAADEAGSFSLSTTYQRKGKIIVVPNMSAEDIYADNGATKIKITYYLDSKLYTYEYELDNDTYEAGKKYIYNITFKLHEIFINPEVEDWKDGGTEFVDIPTYAIGENIDYGTIAKAAGKYQFRITDCTGTPTINVGGSPTAFASTPTYAGGIVTFNVNENTSGSDQSYKLTITDTGGTAKTSVVTFKQAGL